jgi:hypothetical protein
MLPVLYGCEAWSFTSGEEHTLRVLQNRVLQNRVLRRIFGLNVRGRK